MNKNLPLDHSPYHGAEIVHAPGRVSRAKVFVVVLLLLAIAGIAGYFLHKHLGKTGLEAALAEADRLDPGWRIADLEARRKSLPDEQNAALIALKVAGLERGIPGPAGLLPQNWPTEAFYKALDGLEPQAQLNDEQIKFLRTELLTAAPALTEARKLAELPEGRYVVAYSRDGYSTLLPHVQRNRAVTNLLTYDAMLRAHDGKADDALASCRAAMNAGRALGDEPTLISQLVRNACVVVAVNQIERTLAQGQPSDPALAAMQQLLEEEAEHPGLLVAFRGSRGMSHQLMEAVASGEITTEQIAALFDSRHGPSASLEYLDTLLNQWNPARQFGPREHAAVLRYESQLVEIAKLPPEERQPRLVDLEKTLPNLPAAVRMVAPAASHVANADRRRLAIVRCAIVLVACERYRLAHGRWPQSLQELTPAFRATVPLDPFDGKPLRFAPWAEGVVIYSIGTNGSDDDGKVIAESERLQPRDLGFRLWNPDKRRQLPLPKGEEEKP